MAKRKLHRIAHPACPHANWAKCDLAEKVQYGQCKAVVGDREPTPCTRWAVGEEGWCWQHYIALKDAELRGLREAEKQLQLQQRIAAHIERTARDPWFWVESLTPSVEGTRGLKPWAESGVGDGAGGESNPASQSPPWGDDLTHHSAPRKKLRPRAELA